MKKILCIFICVLQIALLFCGCSILANETEPVPVEAEQSFVPSGIIASKGEYSLEWNADRCSLAILKGENVIWASMPLDQYRNNTYDGSIKKHIESHLMVNYKDETTNTVTSVVSYIGALEDGRVYSYLVEDGIRILYCFDEQCFAIPVIYRLRDGYLDVMIENSKIYECGNEVYEISLLPYSCSVENIADNRIFVPDGSGMVMNCDLSRGKRIYSEDVFGKDGAEPESYKFVYNEKIHLPVFAIGSEGIGSLCTIISDGASSAKINAIAGDETIGYSYAYSSFKIRGSETVQIPQGWGSVSITGQYSDISRSNKMAMRIAFIDEYDADFSNIADYYRNYLISEKGLKKNENENLLYLDIPMSLAQRKFFFGIPYDAMEAITTYEQVDGIIEDVVNTTKIKPIVRLSGIQSGGLEVETVAGGFKTEKVLGNQKKLDTLLSNAEKMGVELFPDFDITRFRKSSGGFSVKKDSVKSASSMSSPQYFYSISTGEVLEDAYTYYLLSPRKLSKASEKLVSKIKELGFKNLSLASLGSQVYSDYGYEKGYVGGDYLREVKKTNKLLKSEKFGIMYDSANEYAAVSASHIVNAPTKTSNFNIQDEWLPFYQMVFKGYVPMSSAAINLADIDRDEFLRAVQCGIGINFTVCGKETLEYSTSKFPQLLAGSYENSKGLITKTAKEINDIKENFQVTQIVDFKMLDEGVYATDFSNGKRVVVNYTDNDYLYEETTIAKMNYKFF